MTDRPRGDALDQELRSATRAIVSPTPPPPEYDALQRGLGEQPGGGSSRPRPLVLAAVAIAVIGGVVASVIAANGDDDGGVVVIDDAGPVSDHEGSPDLGSVSVRDLVWDEVVLDTATFGDSPVLIAAAASESMVVVAGAVGDDAALWTSTDRTTWTRVPHDPAVFGGDGQVRVETIVPYGTGFVAAGEIRGGEPGANNRDFHPGTVMAVWISEDGVTWERVRHDEEIFGGIGRQEVFSIAARDDRLVIVGLDEEGFAEGSNDGVGIWTSSDGRAWRQEPGFSGRIWDVTATEDGFVGVGTAVWSSVDGAVWKQVAEADGWVEVRAIPEGFVAISGGGTPSVVWTASDISTWTRVAEFPVPGGPPIVALAAGDAGLVAISGGEPQRMEAGGARMFVSEDGTDWESAASLGLLSESAFFSLDMIRGGHAITAFGPNFVAVGWQFEGSSMWTTRDPTGSVKPADDPAEDGDG